MPKRFSGTNLKAARERMGLTQDQLSSMLCVAGAQKTGTKQAVQNWESGANDPSASVLIALPDILQVAIIELYEQVEK